MTEYLLTVGACLFVVTVALGILEALAVLSDRYLVWKEEGRFVWGHKRKKCPK